MRHITIPDGYLMHFTYVWITVHETGIPVQISSKMLDTPENRAFIRKQVEAMIFQNTIQPDRFTIIECTEERTLKYKHI